MAVANFIPEIWDAALLLKLRDELVYAQPGMINRNYEGDVARAGDTVHITTPGEVVAKDYTRNAGHEGTAVPGIEYDLMSSTAQTITVAQQKYFAIQVDDVDRRQKMAGFVEAHVVNAARALAEQTDLHVVTTMAAGVPAANDAGAKTLTAVTAAYELLVELRTKLVRGKAPKDGRWVVVPPEVYALLLQDDRFIRDDAAGTTAGLRNGVVGRAAGFTVIESNTVPFTDGVDPALDSYTLLAGHGDATTYVDQLVGTEALRLESGFSDAVRGLHVYQAAVLNQRNTLLTKAEVSIDLA